MFLAIYPIPWNVKVIYLLLNKDEVQENASWTLNTGELLSVLLGL